MLKNLHKKSYKSSGYLCRGFGLFEILISVGIIACIILPIVQLLQTIFVNYTDVLSLDIESIKSPYSREFTDGGTIYRTSPKIGRVSRLLRDSTYQTFKHSMASNSICPTKSQIDQVNATPVLFTLSNLDMSSTTIATGIAINGENIYFSTNSSSTTEPDIYMYETGSLLQNQSNSINLLGTKDTGPGISSMDQFGAEIFYQNTGVKNQLGVLSLRDLSIQKTFTIPGSNSTTNPITKVFARHGGKIFIGTEKSVLPEIQIFDERNGNQIGTIETNYGINDLFVSSTTLAVAGPRDPEIEVYDLSVLSPNSSSSLISVFPKIATLDIPGGSGNGKLLQGVGSGLYIGRTKGGEELMKYAYTYGQNSSPDLTAQDSFEELASVRIGWSVDEILVCEPYVFVFTADANEELQIFSTKDSVTRKDTFTFVRAIDLPSRISAARYDFGKLYMTFRDGAYALGILTF